MVNFSQKNSSIVCDFWRDKLILSTILLDLNKTCQQPVLMGVAWENSTHLPKVLVGSKLNSSSQKFQKKLSIKVLLLLSSEVINVGLLFMGAFILEKTYANVIAYVSNSSIDVWKNFQKLLKKAIP